MDLRQIEKRLEEILTKATGWLPAHELEHMLELAQANEPGIALEDFCSQLYEHDVAIPHATVDELRSLASAMGMTVPAWVERGGYA